MQSMAHETGDGPKFAIGLGLTSKVVKGETYC